MAHGGLSLAERGFTEDGKFAKGHKYFPAEHHNRRKRQVTQQLLSQLNEFCRSKKFAGKTNLEAIVEVLIARALEGDLEAIKEIFNRVEGRPPQTPPLDEQVDDDTVFTLRIPPPRASYPGPFED
jgi:hypothetical protein